MSSNLNQSTSQSINHYTEHATATGGRVGADSVKWRRSVRLRGYDYAGYGTYFVTICTRERAHLFGAVVDGAMVLDSRGRIAATAWDQTAARPGVVIDAYVVMPDHVHAIVMIDPDGVGDADVGAQRAAPLRTAPGGVTPNNVASGSLGAVVRAYKSAVTRDINRLAGVEGRSVWQRNYHEHIIRDARDMDRLRAYIAHNPARWAADALNV
jgi:REP element-mobilizing transposase RayT